MRNWVGVQRAGAGGGLSCMVAGGWSGRAFLGVYAHAQSLFSWRNRNLGLTAHSPGAQIPPSSCSCSEGGFFFGNWGFVPRCHAHVGGWCFGCGFRVADGPKTTTGKFGTTPEGGGRAGQKYGRNPKKQAAGRGARNFFQPLVVTVARRATAGVGSRPGSGVACLLCVTFAATPNHGPGLLGPCLAMPLHPRKAREL